MTAPPKITTVVDWVTLGYISFSLLINVCVTVAFHVMRKRHPSVRARGVRMLGIQVLTGISWSCGTFLSFEHIESLRPFHARYCHVVFWITWVIGCCLFMCLLSLRMQRIWLTFFSENTHRHTHTQYIRGLFVAHMLPPIIIGLALQLPTASQKLTRGINGCMFPSGIKIAILAVVVVNVFVLTSWLILMRDRQLPVAFQEVRPTIRAVAVAVPCGVCIAIMVMSQTWVHAWGRCIISVATQTLVNAVVWLIIYLPLRMVCAANHEEAAMHELTDVHIGPWTWGEIVNARPMRQFMWHWMRDQHEPNLCALAEAHALLERWRETEPLPLITQDIISRFVEPASPTHLSAPEEVSAPLRAFRAGHTPLTQEMFTPFYTWLLLEIRTRVEQRFVTGEQATRYYTEISRYDEALMSLENRGLLALTD